MPLSPPPQGGVGVLQAGGVALPDLLSAGIRTQVLLLVQPALLATEPSLQPQVSTFPNNLYS